MLSSYWQGAVQQRAAFGRMTGPKAELTPWVSLRIIDLAVTAPRDRSPCELLAVRNFASAFGSLPACLGSGLGLLGFLLECVCRKRPEEFSPYCELYGRPQLR